MSSTGGGGALLPQAASGTAIEAASTKAAGRDQTANFLFVDLVVMVILSRFSELRSAQSEPCQNRADDDDQADDVDNFVHGFSPRK